MSGSFELTFLGTGTSGGVPEIGCSCPVCRSENPKDKRLRTCAYMKNEKGSVLIDCGPDIREQILVNSVRNVDAVLITHAHADHVLGLNDLRNFTKAGQKSVDLFAAGEHLREIKRVFPYFFEELKQIGGGVTNLNPREIDLTPFSYLSFRIRPLPVKHGILDIYGYTINKKLAYITDASYIASDVIESLKGIPVLVLNTLRYRRHRTHFCVEESLETARQINAKQTFFVHMTHDLSHIKFSKELPSAITPAYDGLKLFV